MIRNSLEQILRRKKYRSLPLKGLTPSAVLVPLVLNRGKYTVVFTQRTDRVRDHKNQISFPGGVREKRDRSLLQTALRETQEEIGLKPGDVKIYGNLADLYTPTGYRITPFVGIIASPFSLHPNPTEIKEIIEVPLEHLMEPGNMTVQRAEFFNRQFDIPYFHYKNHTIWGATGRITRELVSLLRKNGAKPGRP